MTPESIRFHAAGHISAAKVLLDTGNINGVKTIMGVIKEYVNHPKVECPDAIRQIIDDIIENPVGKTDMLQQLEAMFVDDFNTRIEQTGGGAGFG